MLTCVLINLFQVSDDAQCISNLYSAHPDNSVVDSNDGELMSSSGSEGLGRQLSASSSDGLSDKEDALEAVKSQVRHNGNILDSKVSKIK